MNPATPEHDLRQSIVAASREADRRQLNSGTAGNISARTADGMLITPTGIPATALTEELIVPLTLDGQWRGALRPSSEWALHAQVYRAFPHAGAVVHTHADHCVAIACLRECIPAFHYMIAGFGGDDVPCAPYAPFGSLELASGTVSALQGRNACLLANHGAICYAEHVSAALDRAIKLETLARQYWLSRSVGVPALLNDTEMQDARDRYRTYGQQPGAASPMTS
jgi:L-fuculose-phosphate aldolase